MQTIIHLNKLDNRTEVISMTEEGKVVLTTHGDDTLTLVVDGKTYSANVLLGAADAIIKEATKNDIQHEEGNSGNDTSTGNGQ